MKRLEAILQGVEAHRDLAYSLIRMYLGVALFVRGGILLSDPSALTQLAGAEQFYWWYSFIITAHLAGGLLLAVGFLTRLGALLQLPILAGAVFFVHFEQGLVTEAQSLELAGLVLVLLLLFSVFGSGVWAVDNYLVARKTDAAPRSREHRVPTGRPSGA